MFRNGLYVIAASFENMLYELHTFIQNNVNSFLRVFTIEDLLLQPTDYFSRIVRKSLYVDLSP